MVGDGDLQALQRLWNQKLRDSGFEDIESLHRSGQRYLKNWDSLYFHSRYDPHSFQANQEYYERARKFLHDYGFYWFPGSSLIHYQHREIWRLHSEGLSLRDIAERLQKRKWKFNKDNLQVIIKRYAQLMYDFEVL